MGCGVKQHLGGAGHYLTLHPTPYTLPPTPFASRPGSSAMIAARSASVNPLQPPISDRVRQQPRQRLVAPSTTQTLTQGVAMLRGGPGEVCGAVDDMNAKYGPVAD